MASNYRVRNVVLCDDVRMEIGGKPFLIGVYTDAIVIETSLPVTPSMGVYVLVKAEKQIYENSLLLVRDPDGKEVHRLDTGRTEFPFPQFMGGLIFRLSNVPINAEGRYTLQLGMGEPPEDIFSFQVFTRASLAKVTPQVRPPG